MSKSKLGSVYTASPSDENWIVKYAQTCRQPLDPLYTDARSYVAFGGVVIQLFKPFLRTQLLEREQQPLNQKGPALFNRKYVLFLLKNARLHMKRVAKDTFVERHCAILLTPRNLRQQFTTASIPGITTFAYEADLLLCV